MKNQSARGAEQVSAEATGAMAESASGHMKDCGVQNARQNYADIVSVVMGAMCCQPAKMYGTQSSRLSGTLFTGKEARACATPSDLVLARITASGRLRRRWG